MMACGANGANGRNHLIQAIMLVEHRSEYKKDKGGQLMILLLMGSKSNIAAKITGISKKKYL